MSLDGRAERLCCEALFLLLCAGSWQPTPYLGS